MFIVQVIIYWCDTSIDWSMYVVAPLLAILIKNEFPSLISSRRDSDISSKLMSIADKSISHKYTSHFGTTTLNRSSSIYSPNGNRNQVFSCFDGWTVFDSIYLRFLSDNHMAELCWRCFKASISRQHATLTPRSVVMGTWCSLQLNEQSEEN